MAGGYPREYYQRLGVSPSADADVLKRAYRKLAFQYHPDRNPSPEAEEKFKQVTEAYEILTGVRKAPNQPKPKPKPKPKPQAKPQPKPQAPPKPRPQSKPQPKPRPTQAQPQAARTAQANTGTDAAFAACVETGKVSAQPRFVQFEVVKGLLNKVSVERTGGVMSPAGARKAALKASLRTWVLGFWSWKSWPTAFRAILRNISGGTLPRPANAELLYRQARAFEAKGNKETARAVATLAAAYADGGPTRHNIDGLLRRLNTGTPPRKLKSEWRGGIGLNAFAQLSPAMVPIFLILWLASPSEGTISGALSDRLGQLATGLTEMLSAEPDSEEAAPTVKHHVSAETEILNLRSGPGINFPVTSYLDRFQELTVMGPADGIWLPVRTANGQIGYVSSKFVAEGSGLEAEKIWCESRVCN